MEPVDQVQEAVRLQGIHLGQQAGEIAALHQGMETIRSNVQHLVDRLTPQLVAQPTPPSPPGILPRASIEPRLPAQERYEGDPGSCQSFLFTCSQVQVPVLLDSGADARFICPTLVRRMEIPTVPLTEPLRPCAITGIPLEEVHRATVPIKIIMSENYQEEMVFLVISSPRVPLVLGRPWMRTHNPQVDWDQEIITDWSPRCHTSCLLSAAVPFFQNSPRTTTPPDLSSVPAEYHDLGEVFSKSRASSLPPHRSYDCAIDLLSGTSPPRGSLFSLSAPKRLAMEKYIGECLAAGLIHPSSSPAGAGVFFVGKKD